MKNLFLTIMCACMALALMATVPEPDVSTSRLTSKDKSSVPPANVQADKTGPKTLHQFMRERNLTPNDNRLTKKAPRRLSEEDMIGPHIAVMEAQALQDFDSDGNPILSDIVYSLGWNNEMSFDGVAYFEDDVYDCYTLDGFYGKYQVPLYVNIETRQAFLASCFLDMDSVSSSGGRYYNDTIRTTYLFSVNDFFFCDDEFLFGEIYDDGSIWIDGSFLIYTEEVINVYRNFNLASSDTTAAISPILSGLYLLKPNGIHQFKYNYSSTLEPYVTVESVTDVQRIYWEGAIDAGPGSGHGSGLDGTCGSGGLKPKPIGPRKPRSSSPSLPSLDKARAVHELGGGGFAEQPLGGGGRQLKPVTPHGLSPVKSLEPIGPSTPGNSGILRAAQHKPNLDLGVDKNTSVDKGALVGHEHANVINGGGGRSVKPIKPRTAGEETEEDVMFCSASNGMASDLPGSDGKLNRASVLPGASTLGNGGRREGPLRPRSLGDDLSLARIPDGSSLGASPILEIMQAPVYMFQVDDSIVVVYNLFGLGSTVNAMFIHEDGTMTFPGQALYYDADKDDDFCNYSLEEDNSLSFGNTGFVTTDTISWGTTVPYGLNHDSGWTFSSNRLFFIDGNGFDVPSGILRGDVNNDGLVRVNDVSALINHLLSGGGDDADDVNNDNSDTNLDNKVSITDVAWLIDYLLTGAWPQ